MHLMMSREKVFPKDYSDTMNVSIIGILISIIYCIIHIPTEITSETLRDHTKTHATNCVMSPLQLCNSVKICSQQWHEARGSRGTQHSRRCNQYMSATVPVHSSVKKR